MNILMIHGWNPDGIVTQGEVDIYQGLKEGLEADGHTVFLPWLPYKGTDLGDTILNTRWLNSMEYLNTAEVIIGHSMGGLAAEWILRFMQNTCHTFVVIDSMIHSPHGVRWWETFQYLFGPKDQRENSAVWQTIKSANNPTQTLMDVWSTYDASAYPHDEVLYQPGLSHTDVVSDPNTVQAVRDFLGA